MSSPPSAPPSLGEYVRHESKNPYRRVPLPPASGTHVESRPRTHTLSHGVAVNSSDIRNAHPFLSSVPSSPSLHSPAIFESNSPNSSSFSDYLVAPPRGRDQGHHEEHSYIDVPLLPSPLTKKERMLTCHVPSTLPSTTSDWGDLSATRTSFLSHSQRDSQVYHEGEPLLSTHFTRNETQRYPTQRTAPKMWRWMRWRPSWGLWKLWCLLAMLLALIFGVPLGWVLRIPEFTVASNNETMTLPRGYVPAITLNANLISVDPTTQTMVVDWQIARVFCNSTPCENFDIFFDQNLLQSTGGTNHFDNNMPTTPIFSINGTMWRHYSLFGKSPSFKTEICLFERVDAKEEVMQGTSMGLKEPTLQSYPFDRYTAQVLLFATNNQTTPYIGGYRYITLANTSGIATGFTTKLNYVFNDGYIILGVEIYRGTVVQLYAILIVVAVWLVTLTLLSATVSSVILGRKIAKEFLLIPVPTLFAFTQLRATLPGAPPGFGAVIDYTGTLPCLAILTLCSVLQLAVFLFRDPEVDRQLMHERII